MIFPFPRREPINVIKYDTLRRIYVGIDQALFIRQDSSPRPIAIEPSGSIIPFIDHAYDPDTSTLTAVFGSSYNGKTAILAINTVAQDIDLFNNLGAGELSLDHLNTNYKTVATATIINGSALFNLDLITTSLFTVYTTK